MPAWLAWAKFCELVVAAYAISIPARHRIAASSGNSMASWGRWGSGQLTSKLIHLRGKLAGAGRCSVAFELLLGPIGNGIGQ